MMRWVKVKVGDVQMKMSGQRLLTGLVRNCGEFFQRQARSQNFATINISNKSRLFFPLRLMMLLFNWTFFVRKVFIMISKEKCKIEVFLYF